MLQGDLDIWLWLLFPTGAALVGVAFRAAAKAWNRRAKNRHETINSSLPGQVRNVRQSEVEAAR